VFLERSLDEHHNRVGQVAISDRSRNLKISKALLKS